MKRMTNMNLPLSFMLSRPSKSSHIVEVELK